MAHLIDKDALVAEIKARINDIEEAQKAGIIKKRDADMKIILFKSILSLINTFEVKEVQEEPVSEDLEEASRNYTDNEEYGDDVYFAIKAAFKAGAKWQEEKDNEEKVLTYKHSFKDCKEHIMKNIWKSADGDDLPEIDREVIAILDYDFGHYKVVYAHRPNPEGWNGTNIDTGEKEHFEPATYGNGGWNQPHILYWLDARLPYEEK